jgi:tetratricopeptide (TPR) repeat protein
MIADILLEAKHPAEALTEYEASLKNDPGRFDSLYGAAQAASAAGKPEKAKDYYAQVVKNCAGSNSERSELKQAREESEKMARVGGVARYRPAVVIF